MPTHVSPPYGIRIATAHDARQIAEHRALMFRDMGLLSEPERSDMRDASEPWFRELITEGSYIGWLILHGEDVVGGGGLHLRAHGPLPGRLQTGISAHVANIYIEPTHRRRGLAEALIHDMTEWGSSHNVKELTLTASEQGRSLYRRLGFIPNPEFHTMKIS